MNKSFRDKHTETLFGGEHEHKAWESFKKTARRKLVMLDAAVTLQDLKAPPGNKLEALKRDRAGQHAIRINDRFRVCFIWRSGHAHPVEIVDYHD